MPYKDPEKRRAYHAEKSREWREKNPEKAREYQREYKRRNPGKPKTAEQRREAYRRSREKYPEKYRAKAAVSNALANGRLVKQPCEVCGAEKVHGHHDDYSKPLEVRWLCPQHHHDHHRALREQGPS